MNKLINNSLESKKAVAWCNGLITSFVNLIFCENPDLTDENNPTRMFFSSNLISFFDMKATRKISMVVLYNKFSSFTIAY
jgi:hypothetical protein